ncbi:putative 60S ribosomal protein L13a-4-like [Capsicum annuum]|nr:putative 60S ribosomal protein L13a-4-like [Capsicum annuum]
MEPEGDEASHQHPKGRKFTCSAPFSSTSVQDSSFEFPILPADLIYEILLKLPVKSFLKFRSISKSWLGLISSLEFVNTHLSISANNKDFTHHRLMLRFDPPYYGLQDCSFSFSLFNDSVTEAFDLIRYPIKTEIVGSVNGLVCLTIEEKHLLIWNPSIRKFKKLPKPRATTRINSFFMYGAMVRANTCYMYGFGYDEIHDDYRVVVGFRNSGFFKVDMYSVHSDSWRSIDDFPSGVLSMKSGVLVNGKLHWANTDLLNDPSYNAWGIICIDLADGKWGRWINLAMEKVLNLIRRWVFWEVVFLCFANIKEHMPMCGFGRNMGLKSLGQRCLPSNFPMIP